MDEVLDFWNLMASRSVHRSHYVHSNLYIPSTPFILSFRATWLCPPGLLCSSRLSALFDLCCGRSVQGHELTR